MNEVVINGKVYDTNTAFPLAGFCTCCRGTDPHYWEEVLYVKPSGEHFLQGRGNAESKYAKGSQIIPLTTEEARKWCEGHCCDEACASIWS